MLTFYKYGKGGSGGTTTTEVDIPDAFKPYVVGPGGALPSAEDMFKTGGFGTPDKPGSTTEQAWRSGLDLANQFQSTLNPSLTALYKNLQTPGQISGDVLEGAIGSATSPLKEQYARTTIPTIEEAALSAGQFGGSRQGIAEGLAKSELDKNIANMDASMRYQAASDDLARQIQGNLYAAQFAPSMYNLLGTPTNILSSVGQQQDYFSNLAANADLNNLLGYGDFIRQFIPGASSSTKTQKGGSTLGGALAGAGTGALIGDAALTAPIFGPWGAAIGAGLGALGGLFG